ncbi:TetR/AcrR family transcriptional regulator [Mycetocola zhadangensis]|uniref:TetR/AcrR family transcriptional regulator n=1 Tax=Mycetocola zhadangensis TaxID=1164595 RepID=UPI003A4E0537
MSKTRILAEARTVFGRKGYAEASLREIAQAVGIKTPSLYAHFPSKEALFHAVYLDVVVEHAAYFDELANAANSLPPLERLHLLLKGVEDYYRERRDLAEFSLRAAVAEYSPDGGGLRRVFLDSESRLSNAVRQAHNDGVASGEFALHDPEAFTALFFALMDGLFLQLTHYDPDLYRERFRLTWRYFSSLLSPTSAAAPEEG